MSNFLNEHDRIKHTDVMQDFLQYISTQKRDGEYVLKGGTSLMLYYGLGRFSEDIDLDQLRTDSDLIPIVEQFCKMHGYNFRVAKNTPTVQRCMIHYNLEREDVMLKIEVSRRNRNIDPSLYSCRNGVNVYNIDVLALLKNNAFENRQQLRDLYDICFICNNYFDILPYGVQEALTAALDNKGLEYADWLIQTQSDPLVDPEQLMDNVLDAYERCGLFGNHQEKDIDYDR